MGKNSKFVELTRDKVYMIFAMYAQAIREVQTDKVSVSEKLLDIFLPYIQIGSRYGKAMEQLNTSLKEFEKTHAKGTPEYEVKTKEVEKEIKELGKQKVQIDPLPAKGEFLDIIKKEPAYKLSAGQLYTLFHYETADNELEEK